MKRALVIGETGGIGAAVAARLRAHGHQVQGLSRRDGLDLRDEATIAAGLGALDPGVDLVFVATGALSLGAGPEKSLRALDPAVLADLYAVNAIGPALVLKHALRLMPRDRRCVFAALSARVGSIGDNRLGGWYGYRAAKAALNQLIHSGAIELARTHPQAAAVVLHPGTVDTGLTRPHRGRAPVVAPDVAAGHLLAVIDGLGPGDSGGFFDWRGVPIPW